MTVGVAVAAPPVTVLLLAVSSEPSHMKAANTPPPITSNTNSTQIIAIIKRRLLGWRPFLPTSLPSSIGGTGGCTSSVGRLGSFKISAASAESSAAVSSTPGNVVASYIVGTGTSLDATVASSSSSTTSSTAGLFPHRNKAGTIAIRHSTIDTKNTAL